MSVQDDQKDMSEPSSHVPKVSEPTIISKIGYPEFDADDIDTWFMCLEAAFSVNQVKMDKQKFNAVIVALGPRAKFVYSTIAKCNDANNNDRYETLKAAVISHFQPSEAQRLTSLLSGITLGDQKPSILLSEMRRLGGKGCTDSILENLWLRALPTTVRSIIAAMPTSTLDEQAKVADKIMEAPRNEISAIQTHNVPQHSDLEQRIEALSHRLEQVLSGNFAHRQRPRNRSHSRSTQRKRSSTPSQLKNRRWICWFHYRHGAQARKCEKQKGDNPNVVCIFYDGKIPVYVRQEKN